MLIKWLSKNQERTEIHCSFRDLSSEDPDIFLGNTSNLSIFSLCVFPPNIQIPERDSLRFLMQVMCW